MKIELTTTPAPEDAKFISHGLVNFNHESLRELEPGEPETKFSVFARDEHEKIIGGLRATCFWNALHVELIWVSEEARGRGLGSKLMETAEQFARDHDYELALLESTSWQAKEFYEKLGYELLATLPEYPRGHEMYFFTKRLLPSGE